MLKANLQRDCDAIMRAKYIQTSLTAKRQTKSKYCYKKKIYLLLNIIV